MCIKAVASQLLKLEQLECLHSEDTPRHLMITHTIGSSYWIPSPYYWAVHTGSQAHTLEQFILGPKSKEDEVKVTNFKNFLILKRLLHVTHLLKLLDKVCKNEMDPASILEDTERTRFCSQMDRQTDGQTDKVKPVYPPSTSLSGGYKISMWKW